MSNEDIIVFEEVDASFLQGWLDHLWKSRVQNANFRDIYVDTSSINGASIFPE